LGVWFDVVVVLDFNSVAVLCILYLLVYLVCCYFIGSFVCGFVMFVSCWWLCSVMLCCSLLFVVIYLVGVAVLFGVACCFV